MHAVVVDFGLSRVLGGYGHDGPTEHDMLVGTPGTCRPSRRGATTDARTDVYAGVLAYELAAGCVPFVASSPFIVLTAQLEETPVAPRVRARARHRPGARAVVLRALAKSPTTGRVRRRDARGLRRARRRRGAAARPGVPKRPRRSERGTRRVHVPAHTAAHALPVGRSPSSRPPERSLTPTGRPASVSPCPRPPTPRGLAARRSALGTRRRSIVPGSRSRSSASRRPLVGAR